MRLFQGDFKQETIFSEDPVSVALGWQGKGAKRLHVVDLDGAATGELKNLGLIRSIVAGLKIPVQVGGGVRTLAAVEELLGMGVARVIFGTAAVKDSKLVAGACRKWGEAIAVSLDAEDGYIVTHGWTEATRVTAMDLGQSLRRLGVKRLIYTDIRRDGTLTEPNFAAIAELKANLLVPIIASGGVSGLEHVRKLRELGVEAVIIGRALYTGDVKLEEALELVKEA